MGKKKVALIDLASDEKVQYKATGTRDQKLRKQKEKTPETAIPVQPVETKKPRSTTAAAKSEKEPAKPKTKTKKRLKHPRSKRFLEARQLVDKSKTYSAPEAIKLLRQVSKLNFDASVELHCNLSVDKLQDEMELPHGTGKSQKVEIASDKTLGKLKDNLIDFDVLIAEPQMMPKLAKFAKLLGPKGLMPNPKAGTITDKPEALKKRLEKGATRFKSEPKAPLLHLVIGKLSFKDSQLEANLKAALHAVKPKNITTAYLCSSMSPSIKLSL